MPCSRAMSFRVLMNDPRREISLWPLAQGPMMASGKATRRLRPVPRATPSVVRKPKGEGKIYKHGEPFPDDLLDAEGVDINGGIWRYHPTKDRFEGIDQKPARQPSKLSRPHSQSPVRAWRCGSK